MTARVVTLVWTWVLLLAGVLSAAELTASTQPLRWEQVDDALKFHFFVEREEYSTLDRSARFVLATECERAGHKLADLRVRWTVGNAQATLLRGESPIEQGGVSVTFPLESLAPGEYEVSGELLQGEQVLARGKSPLVMLSLPSPSRSGRVPLLLPRGMPLAGQTWPVHAGVPMPKGALHSSDHVRVVDASGREVAADVLVRGRWGHDPQDSVRWLGVLMQAGAAESSWPQGAPSYFLEFGPEVTRATPQTTIRAVADEGGISVDTGAASFRVSARQFNVIEEWSLPGGPALKATDRHGLYVVDHKGTTYRAANDKDVQVTIEEQSAMHVVVRASGWYVRDGAGNPATQNLTLPTDKLCRFVTRIEAYAGKPYVRVMNTLIITFDTFNVRLRDAGMSLPLPEPAAQASFGVEGGDAVSAGVPASGLRGVQHLHDAYTVEDGQGRAISEAKHSAGWVVARGGSAALAMTLRDIWQRYPKELEVLPDAMKLHVWPAHGRLHPQIVGTARDQMHKLMFAHEGPELVMSAPWDYFLAAARDHNTANDGVYAPVGHVMAAVHASGMGVGTTSDVMLQLSPVAQEPRLVENAQCFGLAPHAVADPKWTCASLALGYINPYDPVMFPSIEATLQDMMRGYWRYQDMGQMYGMWIYRSWLHSKYEGDGKWVMYRLYNGTHHHEAIIPWLLYARSGDPFYLKQGMANIRQLTDVQTLHHADDRYTHKEYHAHQRQVVGATKHDNCIAPWGNDHAIMGHVVCYNASITAYYLTGDLRLREVVVDEWLNTLLGNRSSKDVRQADLSGTAFPQNPRDNSVSMSEALDAYQLTYDPRLLVYMAPRHDIWLNATGCMGTDWGQPLHHQLLFRGASEVRQKHTAGIEALLTGQNSAALKVARPIHATQEMFALAGIADPDSDHAFQAITMLPWGYIKGYGWNRMTGKINDVFSNTGEFALFLPRMMYALANSSRPDAAAVLGAGQSAARHPSNPIHMVVREDVDQEFKVYLHGLIKQEKGVEIQVQDPTGVVVARGTAPAGRSPFALKVPTDGKTGQYVVFINAVQKDEIFAPFTRLPEVYLASYWTGSNDPQRYFTRSDGEQPQTMVLEPHLGAATVLAVDGVTELANTENGERLEVPIGPQGAWVWNRTCYISTRRPQEKPAILASTPDRWFVPDERSQSAKPVP
jgi:hypothetical protein